jgi:hypothetical protein
MRLQQSDPIFNMAVDTMRPAFNLEPKYGVTLLTREVWTKGIGVPPAVKVLVCFTDDSLKGVGEGLESMGSLLAEGSDFLWAVT